MEDIKKEEEDLNIIKDLNNIEEVEEDEIENTKKNEEKIEENIIIPEDNDFQIDDENEILLKESERELQAKKDLIEVLEEVTKNLNKGENIPKSITEVYETYLDYEFITKSHIRNKVDDCFLKFIFFVIGPLFGVIFLIGIFQIKSLLNALFELLKNSSIDYYKCHFRSNCNITLIEDKNNVYDFYNYYYEYSMNETIDFNLMMITGFLGNIFIKSLGFKFTTGILCIFNFGSIVWLLNFDFNFKVKGIFDYDFLKLLNILIIYLLFLCGVGGSSLLSHQILVESHLKYKDYLIKKIRDKFLNKKEKGDEMLDINNDISLDLSIKNHDKLMKSTNLLIKNKKNLLLKDDEEEEGDGKQKILKSNTFYSKKTSKEILEEREKQKQKKLEERLNKKEKNKFDFFFMICIITIIGYLGKYGMNLLLDHILQNYIYKEKNYDKRLFLYYIMGLYAISLILSVLLYQIFKMSIFEYDTKKNGKDEKIIKICQICGYIIYTEKKKPKFPPRKNCCRLCCENLQNCCNETFCYLLSIIGCGCCFECYCCLDCCCCCCCCCGEDVECCECCSDFVYCCSDIGDWCDNPDCFCSCICKKCKYDPDDYGKKQEVFRYCYKAERKCLWCNKFVTNNTQKKIFPYMLEYFILQLTTIGFEKHYEKYKNQNVHRKSWILVFISTFILFFYFTLSFTKLFFDDDEEEKEKEEKKIKEDEKEEEKDKEKELLKGKGKEKKEKNRKEMISKLSNDILNGTHGIILFNGIFSLIFSSFYLSNMSEDTKSFFFKDNINIIFMPILMNKFYYFTLNYYCIYTAEKNNKFDIISTSSLISFYIIIWNLALTIVKFNIPDENKDDGYNYYNILYIIQIIFDSIPSLLVVGFIVILFFYSTGIFSYFEFCDCDDCRNNFTLHKFLFCLVSFFLCFGGLWIKMKDLGEYEYECCNVGDCCDIGDNCCSVYCIDCNIYCDCCCCNRKSSCFSERCDKNCNTCKICG